MNEWVRLAVGLTALLGAACAVSWRAGLGAKVARAQVTAAARAVVQLAVVALALRGVFAAPLAAVAVIVVMFSVATWTTPGGSPGSNGPAEPSWPAARSAPASPSPS